MYKFQLIISVMTLWSLGLTAKTAVLSCNPRTPQVEAPSYKIATDNAGTYFLQKVVGNVVEAEVAIGKRKSSVVVNGYGGRFIVLDNAGRAGYAHLYSAQYTDTNGGEISDVLIDINYSTSLPISAINTQGPQTNYICTEGNNL